MEFYSKYTERLKFFNKVTKKLIKIQPFVITTTFNCSTLYYNQYYVKKKKRSS